MTSYNDKLRDKPHDKLQWLALNFLLSWTLPLHQLFHSPLFHIQDPLATSRQT